MKYATAALALLGLTTALPASSDGPVRTLPANWKFEIASLRGPGCPDQGKDGSVARTTRLTFGSNTVDGSEIYYWFIAYPWLRVDLAAGHDHTWCQATIKYTEYKDLESSKEGEEYKLRLHKNGTKGIMTYDLEEGVKAYWDFAYMDGEKEVADTIELTGPISSGQYAQDTHSNISYPPELIPQPKCGSGTFSFRTELWAMGKEGQKGIVESEHSYSEELGNQYYGAQQGFSYDWEKCE